MTLYEINTSRKAKNLDRILWNDYKTMDKKQKEKLIAETK